MTVSPTVEGAVDPIVDVVLELPVRLGDGRGGRL